MHRSNPISTGLSRRNFLRATAGVSSAMAMGFKTRIARAAPAANVVDARVISMTPDLYCGWPTMTRRANGQLLVVFSGGRERHVCPFGRVDMIRSDDDGKTWTWPRTLIDGPIDDRDAGVVETAQGSILVTTFTSLAYEDRLKKEQAKQQAGADDAWSDEEMARWQGAHNRVSAEQRKADLGQWMIRSTDGGVTFSARYRVPVDSPHGPIQLADGRLLYPGKELWTDEKKALVCESRDDGQSWQTLAEIPIRDGDDVRNYHELHGVQCNDGQIVVQIRNHNEQNNRETLQCESTDGGKTWTVPHSIGVWGLPSHLLKLRGGRLLMTYGYRREPFGNQARVSDDHGQSWSEPLTISADGPGYDLGYPSTVELDDGTLLTVWYEQMANHYEAVLRQARWTLES